MSANQTFVAPLLVSANATVENLVVEASGGNGEALFVQGSALVRNVIARASGQDAAAIAWNSGVGTTGTLRGVTTVATGTGSFTRGLSVSDMAIDARNLMARGPSNGSDIDVFGAQGSVTLTSSNYRPSNSTGNGQPRSQEDAPDIGGDEFPDLAPGPPPPPGNLLSNPGAEAGQGAAGVFDVFPPPAWTATDSFTAVRYDAGSGFPTPAADRMDGV